MLGAPWIQMKIAFLMLVHKEPASVARLARLLSSDGDKVFIHVDKSVDVAPFGEHLATVRNSTHLLGERHSIAWGGFAMVRATNALIEAAVSTIPFDYFYLLSGQCFPVRPFSWVKRVLAEKCEYIDCQPMPQPHQPMTRLERRVVNVKAKGFQYRGKRVAEKLLNLVPVPNFQARFRLLPHAGSQWWCLTCEAIQHIRAYRRAHPSYDRFMKWTDIPDEMYYHTLVANGPTANRISQPLTGTIWIPGRRHPEIVTRANLPELLRHKIFLARKFEPSDFNLLNELENALTFEAG
jgi:hypothetical protein